MFKKILTHWLILMLTVLPVQVINAGVKNNTVKLSNIQMSVEKTTQVNHECMHALAKESQKVSQMPCCDDYLINVTVVIAVGIVRRLPVPCSYLQ